MCRGPSHSVLPLRVLAAGMSEDEAAHPPRTSLWEQNQQVRGCPTHGAGAQARAGGYPFCDSVRPGTPFPSYPCWTMEGVASATHFPEGHSDAGGGERLSLPCL